MAKKTALGKGRKSCPTCGTVLAAAARKCACGYVFGGKQRSARGKRQGDIAAQVVVVNEMGGITAARQLLQETKDRVARFEILGGLDAAGASLDFLESLASTIKKK
jgi:hypothetical protein